MKKTTKIIIKILLSFLGFIILILAGFGVYYLTEMTIKSLNSSVVQSSENQKTPWRDLSAKEKEDLKNAEYPDNLVGIINFPDQNGLIKTTLATGDGTEYVFTPNQPSAVYKTFGVESGDKVQVQCKILEDHKIKWISIKLFSN